MVVASAYLKVSGLFPKIGTLKNNCAELNRMISCRSVGEICDPTERKLKFVHDLPTAAETYIAHLFEDLGLVEHLTLCEPKPEEVANLVA